MGKYNDLMNNIVVTEDMKNRILQNIEDELDGNTDTKSNDKEKVSSTDKKEKISFFHTQTYRTWLSVAAAVLIVTASGIAIKTVIGDGYRRHDSATMSEGAMGNMTPTQEAFEAPEGAAEAAAEEAAYEVPAEEINETEAAAEDPVHKQEIKSSKDAAPTDSKKESDKETGNEPHICKVTGQEADYVKLTGDDAKYSVIEETKIGNVTVTVRGNGDKLSSAMWYDGSETFAVYYDEPVSKEALTEAVEDVIAKN
ncbi:hypothetical protein [Butyrivibrio sp. INlla21]|uniref:hypothetical protein n=1 Tax=Butyrivibrio sp. INlla21 TaxID=1520811 RepID=UPI001160C943|nr:hypothetical protein [Butyrivibrio sp. INlla21]